MSKNINQVFMSNPATEMEDTDLIYIGRSPYGITNDMAILWSDMVLSIDDTFMRRNQNFKDVDNPEEAFQNLGTGTGESITITDGDFVMGVYQIPVPFPYRVVCNALAVTNQTIRLPVANTAFDSPALGQGVVILMSNSVSVDIALSDGTVIDNLEDNQQTRYICQDKSDAAGSYLSIREVNIVNSNYGRIFLSSDNLDANLEYTPVNYTPDGGIGFPSDSITGNLKGIDNALGSINGFVPSELVYVDEINGDDSNTGSITSPLKTYNAALLLAESRNPQYGTGQCIVAMTSLNITGDMVISPYVNVVGYGKSSSVIVMSGNIILSSLWETTGVGSTIIQNVAFVAQSIDFNFTSYQEGAYIRFENCSTQLLTPTATIIGSDGSGNSNCETVIFNNCSLDLYPGIDEPQFISDNVNLYIFNSSVSNSVQATVSSATVEAKLLIQNCIQNLGDVTLSTTSTGTLTTNIQSSNPIGKTLTVDGTSNSVFIDASSNNFSSYVFTNGSSWSNINGANPLVIYIDQLNGNDNNSGSINYPMQNYDSARLRAIANLGTDLQTIGCLIVVLGNQNVAGDMILTPGISIDSQASPYNAGFSVEGDVVIDPTWGTTISYCAVKNVYIYIGVMSNYIFTFPAYNNASFLKFVNCVFNTGGFITITGSGTSEGVENVTFENCTVDFFNYTPGFIAENVNLYLINTDLTVSDITFTASAAIVQEYILVINNARFYTDNINVVSNNTSTAKCYITASNTMGKTLTIDGTNNTVIVDSTSYMFTLALANGATLSDINIPTLSDGMTGNLTPTNYTPTGSATDKADSITGHLRGIDAALVGGGGVNIDALIFVSEISGNDSNTGSITSPLQTYAAARAMALTRSPAYGHEITIMICGALNITGNFVIEPNVNVFGLGGTYSTQVGMTGGLVLSSNWNTASIPQCQINGIQFIAQTMNLNRPTFNAISSLRFQFCSFQILAGSPTFTGSGTGAGGECETIILENCNSELQIATTNYFFDMLNVYIWNTDITGNLSVSNSSTTSIAKCNVQNVPNVIGNITLIALTATGTLETTISATNTRGKTLTVNGQYNTVHIDSTSYQFGAISFGSGATIANIIINSLADGVNANANFIPTNYTPVAPSATIDVNSVTSNLLGIDNALGGKANVFPYVETTSVAQIAQVNTQYTTNNASVVSLTLPTTSAIGDKIIVNGKGSGGWRIDQQNAGHAIKIGALTTTTGPTGSFASATQYASATFTCITTNDVWLVQASEGTFTIV